MVTRSLRQTIRRQAENILEKYPIQQVQLGIGLNEDEWSALTDLYMVVASFSGSDMWRADHVGRSLRLSALTELERVERSARDAGDVSLASGINGVARLLSQEFSA